MPPDRQGSPHPRKTCREGGVAESICRISIDNDHPVPGGDFIRDIARLGIRQDSRGSPGFAERVSIKRTRALRVTGMQAADLHPPLLVFLRRRRGRAQHRLADTMAEFLGVTSSQI